MQLRAEAAEYARLVLRTPSGAVVRLSDVANAIDSVANVRLVIELVRFSFWIAFKPEWDELEISLVLNTRESRQTSSQLQKV